MQTYLDEVQLILITQKQGDPPAILLSPGPRRRADVSGGTIDLRRKGVSPQIAFDFSDIQQRLNVATN